jgi:TRAP-type C4-dicarboxylate transport system permease small subunit
MRFASLFLAGLSRFERLACGLAFLVMALSLAADVAKRVAGRVAEAMLSIPVLGPGLESLQDKLGLGAGILGAPQIAVVGMIAVAMFGFGIAAQSGAQLRARFLDWVFPKTWSSSLDRAADLITSAALLILATLSFMMVQEAARLGDVTSVLRWPIWPIQGIIALAFGLNALRFLLFFLFPVLRPQEDLEPATPQVEEVAA